MSDRERIERLYLEWLGWCFEKERWVCEESKVPVREED